MNDEDICNECGYDKYSDDHYNECDYDYEQQRLAEQWRKQMKLEDDAIIMYHELEDRKDLLLPHISTFISWFSKNQ